MTANEDRDRLFGVMALELGFISQDALDAAMTVRERDRDKSLGRILVEANALGGEEYALLEALVDKHIKRHGHDAKQSLTAWRSARANDRMLDGLATQVAAKSAFDLHGSIGSDDRIPVTLPGLADEKATPIPADATLSQNAPPGERRQRYRILRHHASGGLGRVLVAYDEDLNREVALKEIHARFAHLADCRSRFLLEAEVTGRLEHPGIVPVYGLGRYANGLPYYTMRLIRGASLKEAIQTFHETRFADTGQRMLALRHLLGVFLAVCQAVRYAHSRGVVHRDLKPENVMLGKFGETLVVDWGLAKAVNPSPEAATAVAETTNEGPVRPEPEGVPLVTRAGTVLGTPGYMSPEQADGLLHEAGPATDVYSLGATLYTILTGKPPLTAEDLAGALEERSKGRFPPPRALDRRVPRALEAVCLKAMALLPADRYPSVRELADDVERWLAYEPVSAYREPVPARIARSVRRHPARMAGLMATVLVGALGLLAVVLVIGNSNRELAAANRRESEARVQADARFREAQGAVNEFFTEISENKELLKKQPGTQALRRQLLEKARDYYERFLRERGNDPAVRAEAAAAHYRLGDITNSLNPGSPRAVEQFERGVAVLQPLVRNSPTEPQHFLLLARLYGGMGMTLGRADHFDDGLASFEKARLLLEGPVSEHADTAAYAYELARTYGGIANIQGRAHKTKEALAANARSAAICEELCKKYPDVSEYAERLAIAYLNIGTDQKASEQYEAALQSVARSLAVAERLVGKNPGIAQYVQIVVYACNNMGHYQTVLGRFDEALSTLTRGVEVAERLTRDNPDVPDYQNILAFMHFNRGSVQLQQGALDEARSALQRAKETIETLVQEYPAVHQYALLQARILQELGWAQFAAGNAEDAAASFSRCLSLWERLHREDPKVLEPASYAAWLLADCPLTQLRDPVRATSLAQHCLAAEPDAPGHLKSLGLARYRAGDSSSALAALEKAFKQMSERNAERPPVALALVLARWQAGQLEAARELFVKTTAMLDTSGLKHPEYRALRREAAALLKVEDPAAPAKPSPGQSR